MQATLTSKGQMTFPKAIRDKLGLEAGDKLEFTLTDVATLNRRSKSKNQYSLRPANLKSFFKIKPTNKTQLT